MPTAVFIEKFENVQHSALLIPRSQSQHTFNSSHKNLTTPIHIQAFACENEKNFNPICILLLQVKIQKVVFPCASLNTTILNPI
jgi:hypothetical protein